MLRVVCLFYLLQFFKLISFFKDFIRSTSLQLLIFILELNSLVIQSLILIVYLNFLPYPQPHLIDMISLQHVSEKTFGGGQYSGSYPNFCHTYFICNCVCAHIFSLWKFVCSHTYCLCWLKYVYAIHSHYGILYEAGELGIYLCGMN